MDKYIYDEKNGLWYELQGDYYLPCLKLPEEVEVHIGVWGQRHRRYLKEHRKTAYTRLLTSGKLNSYLNDIRSASEKAVFSTGKSDDGSRRCHRSVQSGRPDGMDTPHEQHPEPRRRTR